MIHVYTIRKGRKNGSRNYEKTEPRKRKYYAPSIFSEKAVDNKDDNCPNTEVFLFPIVELKLNYSNYSTCQPKM